MMMQDRETVKSVKDEVETVYTRMKAEQKRVKMYSLKFDQEGEYKRLKTKWFRVLNSFNRVANEMMHIEKHFGNDKYDEVDA